jgi:preprotein translocase subunit SecG
MNQSLQVVAIIYICGLLLLWAYSYYKGKKIVEYLKLNHLAKWEELEKPGPDYLNASTLIRWTKFISQSGYVILQDNHLDYLCENQKRLERHTIILTILFFVLFGGVAIWFKYLA